MIIVLMPTQQAKACCNPTWDAGVDRHALHRLAPLVCRGDGARVRREAQVEHLRTLTPGFNCMHQAFSYGALAQHGHSANALHHVM